MKLSEALTKLKAEAAVVMHDRQDRRIEYQIQKSSEFQEEESNA